MTDPGRVYLDHAATAFPRAPGVAQAMVDFLDRESGNPGRGGHRLSVAASRAVEAAREEVAELMGADFERTLLGPGATHWLNLVLSSRLGPGDAVVTSALEHNAVMRPLRHLEATRGVRVQVVEGAGPHGVLTPDEVAEAVEESGAALVVLTQASNVSGAALPVAAVAARVAPVPVLVDGAQGAGSLPFDFAGSGASAYACSGHKGLLGPPGTGVLLLAEGFEVEPLIRGGTGSRSEEELMPALLPDRLEAGTPNTVGLVGLGRAAAWLREQGVEALHRRTAELFARAAEGLAGVPGVRLVGHEPDAPRTAVLSFTLGGVDAGELGTWLDLEHGLMLRVGLHCAPAAHRRLGTFPEGTLRLGLGPFNREADVDRLVAAVAEARAELGGGGRDGTRPDAA